MALSSSMALTSALSLVAGAYLNAKLSLSTDISQILGDRAWAKRLGRRMAELSDSATIYKMLERVVDVDGHGSTEALWFENRTWSYSQLKEREFSLPFLFLTVRRMSYFGLTEYN